MRFEAKGQLDEAQEIYDTILQEDDTNMVRQKVFYIDIVFMFLFSWHQNVKLHYSRQEIRNKR